MPTNFYWQELVSPCFNCFQLYYNTKKLFVKGEVFQLKTGYRFWLANDLLLAGEPSILEEQRGKIKIGFGVEYSGLEI